VDGVTWQAYGDGLEERFLDRWTRNKFWEKLGNLLPGNRHPHRDPAIGSVCGRAEPSYNTNRFRRSLKQAEIRTIDKERDERQLYRSRKRNIENGMRRPV